MLDRFTQLVREESLSSLTDHLAEGSGLIVSAVEGFYDRISAGVSLQEAYALLRDELGTSGWGGADSSDDERLRGLSPSWAVRRALACVEARRREDELRNPYTPTAEEWPLAEFLLDNVGQPTPLAVLQTKAAARYGGKLSPQAIAESVVKIANENPGRIAPAKTKVEGKVAYGLLDSDERPRSESGSERDRWHEPKVV